MTGLSLADILPSLDPWLIVGMAAIFLLAGTIKGFLGIGLPASAMGFLTLFIPPTEAIPLLWLSILATNVMQFSRAPQKREIVSTYWLFALAIVISIFITSMFMADYPAALLTVAIGFAMIIFSLNLLIGFSLPIGPGRGWQVGVGLISGILGGLSSIWSPAVAMYLVARDTPKERFIGASGFLFLAGVLPLGAGQVIAGLITIPVLLKSAVCMIFVLAGFRVGELLRARISQDGFRTVVLIAFLIMGVRLIATGLL